MMRGARSKQSLNLIPSGRQQQSGGSRLLHACLDAFVGLNERRDGEADTVERGEHAPPGGGLKIALQASQHDQET